MGSCRGGEAREQAGGHRCRHTPVFLFQNHKGTRQNHNDGGAGGAGGGQQVSLEGRLKVREELREQTGPANPQPPELESTVTAPNPQTRLHGHDWRVDPKSKGQARWGRIRGQNCSRFISPGSKLRNKQNT